MDNAYNNEERELSIVALLFDVLLKWRKIAIWMIIGAVLFGGVSFVKSYVDYKAINAPEQNGQNPVEQLEQLEEFFSDKQINDLNNLIAEVTIAEDRIEQYEKSEIMKMNPDAVPKSELLINISVNDNTQHGLVVNTYYDLLTSTNFVSYIVEQVDRINVSDMSSIVRFNVIRQGEDENSTLLSATVINSSEETCKKIVGLIKAYLDDIQDGISMKHSYEIISNEYTCIYDADVKASQESIKSSIRSYKSTIINLKDGLTAEEKQYYELMTGDKDDKDDKDAPVFPTISVKYILIGAIAFAFIYCVYACVSFVFSECMRENDDITTTFGIPRIMGIARAESKQRNRIDRFIINLRDKNKKPVSSAEAIELAATKIMLQLQDGDKRVYCLGSDGNGQTLEIADSIKKSLADKGIEMVVLSDVMYNNAELATLENAENVFLVETAGKSRYDDVYAEIAFLRRIGTKILGMVVVE